jgi:hypothetical protein
MAVKNKIKKPVSVGYLFHSDDDGKCDFMLTDNDDSEVVPFESIQDIIDARGDGGGVVYEVIRVGMIEKPEPSPSIFIKD